ncbi:MAG: isocitrate lyase/phosphoenolpyruvate mutase family protein [Pseudomonadota bacterium]
MTEKSAFRLLHERPGAFIIPNPWDRGTARMLAALGFEALATTSAGAAFGEGVREGTMSPQAMLDHCRVIAEATPLPVSADLEKGFGDSPDSAAETIKAAAAIGLAGASLEDHTGDRANPIYDFDLAVERIAAAVEARDALDADFVLTARAENHLWGRHDVGDTIRRLQAFEAAGADVLYAPGLRDLDTIRQVCAAVTKPVNVIRGGVRGMSLTDLASAGVKRVSVGSALARAAFGTFIDAAEEMATRGTFEFGAGMASFEKIESLLPEN